MVFRLFILMGFFYSVDSYATGGAGVTIGLGIYLFLAIIASSILGMIANFILKKKSGIKALNLALLVSIVYTFLIMVEVMLLSTWWHRNVSTNDKPMEILVPCTIGLVWITASVYFLKKSP